MSANIDIAYAAGLFDGEGSVAATFEDATPKVCAAVAMYSIEPIRWLQETFGGTTCVLRKGTSHECHQWLAQGGVCVDFLSLVLGHLKVKRPQAELALAFFELRPGKGKSYDVKTLLAQSEIVSRIKELNGHRAHGKGDPAPAPGDGGRSCRP